MVPLPLFFIGMLGIFSCAYNYKKTESFAQKMHRYQAKTHVHFVPKLKISLEKFKKHEKRTSAQSRRPASAQDKQKIPRRIVNSNKKLYFLSLLKQYDFFRRYAMKPTPEIKVCPHFHSAILYHRQMEVALFPFSQNVWERIEVSGPLLSLPLKRDARNPTIRELSSKQLKKYGGTQEALKKALAIHGEKIYSELSELCEYGSSDNYYAYENLMGHIKKRSRGFSPSPKNFQALIRTTLFSNQVLLKRLTKRDLKRQRRGPASVKGPFTDPYLQQIMKKAKVHWAEKYLHTVD